MTDTASKTSDTPTPTPRLPHIGAFVLETLTLGMYGEPRHTLREYVQNAFDSIRSARNLKVLDGRGQVTITLERDKIVIRDNGLGVAKAQAYATLTSVGASKKDRQRDAGFRGIGRLAGMAYCDVLTFETTFPGETAVTTVDFDCEKLLAAMDPDSGGDMELSRLLSSAITFTQDEDGAASDAHYFEVRMTGLSGAPDSLTEAAKVRDYLSETVPVAYDPKWARAAEIEQSYRNFFGAAVETIDLKVVSDGVTTQIFKSYGSEYEHAKGTTDLAAVEFEQDPDGRFWGWVGKLKPPVAVTNWQTRGLRMRVRNIQIDGTQLFEKLFSEVKPSYGRFSTYYVGEIHLASDQVVPNARRDGFEETPEWLSIKKALVEGLCTELASEAYKASENAQTDIKKVLGDVESLSASNKRLTTSSKASYEQVVDLMSKARRLRRKTATALKVAGDVDALAAQDGTTAPAGNVAALRDATREVEAIESQARMLIGRFMDDDEKSAALRSRIREELIQEVLEVVQAYVDPQTYQAVRKRLLTLV